MNSLSNLSMSKRDPAALHFRIDRPDLADVEIRTNWINPAAIAMVTKQQKGNVLAVKI